MKILTSFFCLFLLTSISEWSLNAQTTIEIPADNFKRSKFNAESSSFPNIDSNNYYKSTETIEEKQEGDVVMPITQLKYAKDSMDAPVEYKAKDSIIYDIPQKTMYLYGDASVVYKDITIKGGVISYNWDIQEVESKWAVDSLGNKFFKPEFSQAENIFQADQLRFNFKSKKGKSLGAVTRQSDGYLHSSEIKNISEDVFFGNSVKYTSCEYDHPHFYIEIGKAKIIKDKVIVGKPANLVIEDTRTPLFLPFGVFPILKKRNTGLLMPQYGETQELGFFLKGLGYYWAINDNVNMTVTGDIYSLGSWGITNNMDFNKRYKYSGNINLSFTSLQQSERRSSSFTKPSKEFFVNSSFRIDPKKLYNGNFSASVYAGTRSYHQFNVTDAQTFLNNTYRSSIAYQKWWTNKPMRLSVSANHSQNTQTKDITFQLPQFNFAVSRVNPFQRKVQTGGKKWYENIGFSYNMDMQNQINTKDSLLFKKETLENMRNRIKHSLPISSGSFSLGKFLNLSLNFDYTERWYFKYQERIYHEDVDTFYVEEVTKKGFKMVRDFGLSANFSTRLYGMLQFKKGKIKAIRHVVNPQISFNYRPDFGHERWGYYGKVQTNPDGTFVNYNKFSKGIYGSPTTGAMGGISFNVNNNLEMKVRSKKDTVTGEKKIPILENFTFGGSYNFIADSFQLSDIRFSANNRISKYLSLNLSGTLDPYLYDKERNRRTPKLGITNGGQWLRLRNMSLNLSGSWQSKSRDGRTTNGDEFDPRIGLPDDTLNIDGYYIQDQVFGAPLAYVDFNIPISINYNYSLNINRFYSRGKDTASITQTLSAGINFSLTPKWKVSVNTGFDFTNKEISRTDISVYRDLHCWQLAFNWVPLGFQRSFSLELNVKSQMLKDLKLAKRKMWVDYD
ncbi:MAG: hypothetical protein M9958_09405 [Chitinophagales bacterium]|nr:hypothetical protein [Chitinophagales bacterium]